MKVLARKKEAPTQRAGLSDHGEVEVPRGAPRTYFRAEVLDKPDPVLRDTEDSPHSKEEELPETSLTGRTPKEPEGLTEEVATEQKEEKAEPLPSLAKILLTLREKRKSGIPLPPTPPAGHHWEPVENPSLAEILLHRRILRTQQSELRLRRSTPYGRQAVNRLLYKRVDE